MMKRSIVMTSDPFAMPVRGKSDRTVPIGPENRDSVSRQPLEDLGGRVPVVVVPTDADHGLARRELVQPLVRRRGPRPVMTDLQEVDAPHLPGQPAFHRQPRVGLEQEPDRAGPHPQHHAVVVHIDRQPEPEPVVSQYLQHHTAHPAPPPPPPPPPPPARSPDPPPKL